MHIQNPILRTFAGLVVCIIYLAFTNGLTVMVIGLITADYPCRGSQCAVGFVLMWALISVFWGALVVVSMYIGDWLFKRTD